MVRPSKSNSRHLIRRACFNLPKLSAMTTAQSTTSLTNTTHPNSPSSHSAISIPVSQHPVIDQSLSAPLTQRKPNINDDINNSQRPQQQHLLFTKSQSKEAPSRGISPRINRQTPPSTITTVTASNNTYNPSSIEKL